MLIISRPTAAMLLPMLLRNDGVAKPNWHNCNINAAAAVCPIQAGVAESKWAIEYEQPAADAFKLNNPQSAVYARDCNAILAVRTIPAFVLLQQ